AEAKRAEGEREARREALAAAAAAKEAKNIAEERAAETQAGLDFVQNKVFAAARPEGRAGGLGHDVTLRQAIQTALPFVEKSFAKQPLIEARLRVTLGGLFWYLGEAKIAAEQYRAGSTLYSKHRGADHPDTLRSMQDLANAYHDLDRDADALQIR